MPTHTISKVEVAGGHRLRLWFEDGTSGVVDLADRLWGPMFESLRNPDLFKRVKVDPESGTIVWPNGADFSPETLYREVRHTPATH